MDEDAKDDGAENNDRRVEPAPPTATEKQELGTLAGSHHQPIGSGTAGSCDQPVDDGAVGSHELEASSRSGTGPIRSVFSVDAKEFFPTSQESGITPSAAAAAAATSTGDGYEEGMGFQYPPLYATPPPHYSYYPSRYGDTEYYAQSSLLVPGYGYSQHYQQPSSPLLYGSQSQFLFQQRPPMPPDYRGYPPHIPPVLDPNVQLVDYSRYSNTSPTQTHHTPLDSSGHKGGLSQTPSPSSEQQDDRSQTSHSGSSRRRGSGGSRDRVVSMPPIINPPKKTTNKPSFLSAAKHGPNVTEELESFQDKMVDFLKMDNLQKNQGASSFGPSLQVDFLELLYHDKKFATDVCNQMGTDDYWLRQAANRFCKENGFPTENASIDFINMPKSIHSASRILEVKALPLSKKVSLCENRMSKHVLTVYGRDKLRIILWDTLEMLLSGEAWEEELTINDLMFAQVTKDPKSLKLIVAKRPSARKPADPRVGIKPLQDIWKSVEPYYQVEANNEKSAPPQAAKAGSARAHKNDLPLYLKQLKRDLNAATILDEEFVMYLRYHPALSSSAGRKILIDGIHQARKEFRMETWPKFFSCFTDKPYKADWRQTAKRMDILKSLLDFQFDAQSQKKSMNTGKGETSLNNESSQIVEKIQKIDEEKGGTTSGVVGKGSKEDRTGEGKGKQISEVDKTGEHKDSQTSEEQENYFDTSWSLVGYKRNGHQHLGQYVKVQDPDEVELFLAAFFEDFLPEMIRKLLRTCQMGGMFSSAWSAYKACVLSDDQETPDIPRPKPK